MSRKEDVDKLLYMIKSCFVEEPVNYKIPSNWYSQKSPCKLGTTLPKLPEINFGKSVTGVLRNVYLYPVKSCAAFRVSDDWELCDKGLKFDRKWMVVNSANVCLTQKMHKRLCLIKPSIDLATNTLSLSSEGM